MNRIAMILLTLAAFTMSPVVFMGASAQEGNSCGADATPILIDGTPHCAVQRSGEECPPNEAGVPGVLVEINSSTSCAHGKITNLDGADILLEQDDAAQAPVPEEEPDPFAGLSCSIEGHELVMMNGAPICKGPTVTKCDPDELKALIPASAFNEVWVADKCSWQYELANN